MSLKEASSSSSSICTNTNLYCFPTKMPSKHPSFVSTSITLPTREENINLSTKPMAPYNYTNTKQICTCHYNAIWFVHANVRTHTLRLDCIVALAIIISLTSRKCNHSLGKMKPKKRKRLKYPSKNER
jgi:hypothetical protein